MRSRAPFATACVLLSWLCACDSSTGASPGGAAGQGGSGGQADGSAGVGGLAGVGGSAGTGAAGSSATGGSLGQGGSGGLSEAGSDATADVGPDAPQDAAQDAVDDAEAGAPVFAWTAGLLGTTLPSSSSLLPLPGEGAGPPVVTSNNPETFTTLGYLYQTARSSPTRGGGAFPLSGKVGVYLHHLNTSGSPRYVQVVLTNPGTQDVTVSAFGSGYNQTETGGLGFGYGPDYQVAEDWLTGVHALVLPPTVLPPLKPLQVFVKPLNDGAELDGRFELESSGPVYCYVSATASSSVNDVIQLSTTEATGNIAQPGTPPPPFGREAGVYAHDRWKGEWDLEVPDADAYVGFMVNTALGSGMPQDQAFPALARFDDSSAESVGNYGNVYDLTIHLHLPSTAAASRRVRVAFAGNVPPSSPLSFQWNGPARVDGALVPILIRPQAPRQNLATYDLAPGDVRTFTFEAPVPGLTSIWQMLLIESSAP